MASPSPVLGASAQPPGDRTRDSLATSLGKSYGTVKDASQNMSSYRSVINHDVVKEDTLQGLALKYDVTVQDIRRANNLWASESIQSRLVLKIPVSYGDSGSRNPSPRASRSLKAQSKQSSSLDHLPKVVASNGTSHKKFDENDEEVRSKPRTRYISSGASYSSSDGVKSIADIFNSADEQLKLSREFADRMAIRSATLSLPPDSYNRLPHVSVTELSSSQPLQPDNTSATRRTFKIPSMSSEKVSASREKVEEDMFEL